MESSKNYLRGIYDEERLKEFAILGNFYSIEEFIGWLKSTLIKYH